VEVKGEYRIGTDRQRVWEALNDPEILQRCIPGCESLERLSDTELQARVMVAIGPVRARFNTSLMLQDLNPPQSYTLVGESKAGAAGFGRGQAHVTLSEQDGGTLLVYEADFKVGGKLAQVGSRLVLGATRKIADDFFNKFSLELDPRAQRFDDDIEPAKPGVPKSTWLAVAGAIAVLLIWWFLLR
jgi:carbon monoxide dehydrogenase subunit G